MFRTDSSVGMLKSIAMIAGLAILLWSLGLPSLRFMEAANVSLFSDTLSDSAPSAASTHTISFKNTTEIANGETMTLTFVSTAFTGIGSIVDGDVTIADDTVDISANVSAAGSGQVVTLTLDTGTIAAGSVIDIVIGSTNFITNPGPEGSYKIELGGTMTDSGTTRVVILTAVTVQATVDTVFTFKVDGTTAGTAINSQTTTGDSSSTTIQFGKLSAGVATTSAQQLTVSTNAANGYVVTVQLDGALRSSTGEDINGFDNGSDTDIPTVWGTPDGTVGSLDTYGHWGVTSDDTTITDRTGNQFADNLFVAASTTPREVMQHTGPVTTTSGQGIGTTTVGYRVEISSLQQAGDYATTLTYVATPTF